MIHDKYDALQRTFRVNSLQRAATRCDALQHTATGNALQRTATKAGPNHGALFVCMFANQSVSFQVFT